MTQALRGLRAARHGWDTVVHLGAGDGRSWLSPGTRIARRHVLVEGDGDTAARLRVLMRGRDDVTIIDRVVGPVSGTGPWYLHNVRSFDGLIRHDAVAEASRYPRLRCTGQRAVAVRAVGEVLDEGLAGRGADGPHALVIDLSLPGFAWAAADAARSLARFHGISITPAAWSDDANAVSTDLADALRTAGFVECRGADRGAAIVFERDEAAWHARRELALLASVEADLQQLRSSRQAGLADLARADERIAALEAEVRRLRERQAAGDQQRAEIRLAIARADGALRALDPLLRPEGGGPPP
ncbi:MAG TPA: hypothetical protein VJM48_01005 [Methylibium sp.]|nr:hypothetical protein [Methylibium sp.]